MPDDPSESDGSVDPDENPEDVPDLWYKIYTRTQKRELYD